jgi:tetratricopeptide (TPR) repeat protein
LFKEQEQICRQDKNEDGLEWCLGNQALIMGKRGDLDGALALHKEEERICRQLGKLDDLQICLGNQALILKSSGDTDNALKLFREKGEICRQLGKLGGLQWCLKNQALIMEQRKELDLALALLKEEEQICRQLNKPDLLKTNLDRQAQVLRAQKDLIGAFAIHTGILPELPTESAIPQFAHPFSPEALWSFSISQRFGNSLADQLLSLLRPVLAQRGVIMECRDASIDPESKDFWMNRMKVILELADFQIFVEMGDSAQVEFEVSYARTVTRRGRAPALATNFEFKRRKSRVFRPIVICIRGGWGIDRFSRWSNRAVVYCRRSSSLEEFCERFATILDRCIASRARSILRWYRMDENAMHRSARLKLKLMNLLMRFVAYKAKRNPNILLKMGGSIENACKMLEAQKVDNETRSRPLLAVRKTLVRESVLAQIIARNPKALDAYSELKASGVRDVVSENEIEKYLLTIRRGEALFNEPFAEVYSKQKVKIHETFESKLAGMREKESFKKLSAAEQQTVVDNLKRLVSTLEPIAGFTGALSFKRRVRQAKGRFHKEPQPPASGR